MSTTGRAAATVVRDLTLEHISEGQSATLERQLTDADIDAFAALSGDVSPLHVDADYARAQGMPGRVVHGALLVALVSRLIGTELPGRRALLLSVRMEFVAPTFAGDTVQVAATVASVHAAQQVIQLRITIRCGAELRAQGSALVRVREETA